MLTYDPLSEYHLYNPELKLYNILEEIKDLIAETRTREVRNNGNKKKEIVDKIQILLTEPTGKRLLEMICRKNNLVIGELPNKEGINSITKNPNILLQLLFLNAVIDSYAIISQALDLDQEETKAIIEYLKKILNIDDPLVWLQNFLSKDKRYQRSVEKNAALQRGIESADYATDTAEERKLKKRRKNLLPDSNKPPSTT